MAETTSIPSTRLQVKRTAKSDNEFDYVYVRDKYMSFMFQYVDKMKNTKIQLDKRPLTDNRKSDMIKKIQYYDKYKAFGKKMTRKDFATLNDYQVLEENGKNILLKKSSSPNNVIEYLSYEDSFDVIADAHQITLHGGRFEIEDLLENHFVVHPQCIIVFLRECNVCKPKDTEYESNKEDYNFYPITSTQVRDCIQPAFVDILVLTNRPDGEFNHILIYVDENSLFTLLRPLTIPKVDTMHTDETAMELLNIFVDFGAPDRFRIFRHRHIYFMNVFVKLKEMCNCRVQITHKMAHLVPIYKCVLKGLEGWMTRTKCNNWALACHVLQRKMNMSTFNNFGDCVDAKQNNTEGKKCDESTLPFNRMFKGAPGYMTLVAKTLEDYGIEILENGPIRKKPAPSTFDIPTGPSTSMEY